MEKLIDLHTHTSYSDGEDSPDKLIEQARMNNIATIAITDHDTLEGVKNITDCSDIEFIPGIELSAKVDHGRLHILGYDIDINNESLNQKMSLLRDNSLNSLLSVMEQIKRDYGIRFSYDDIKALVNANHNLGRPDLAKLCVKYGYANSIQDAFDKYLIAAHDKVRITSKGLSYSECIDLILKSDGIPVLAHPKSLELSKREFLIFLKDLINNGLMGIEVYHSSHNIEDMSYYLSVANEYNLLVSGGSDYHGKIVKPDIALGTGNNNLCIKQLSLVDYIRSR